MVRNLLLFKIVINVGGDQEGKNDASNDCIEKGFEGLDHANVIVNEEECTKEYYCKGDETKEIIFQETAGFTICLEDFDQGGGYNCELIKQCNVNSCDKESIYHIGSITNRDNLMEVLLEYDESLASISIDCNDSHPESHCSCKELVENEVFPKCRSCAMAIVVNNDKTTPKSLIDLALEAKEEYGGGEIKARIFPNPFKNEINIDVTLDIDGDIVIQVVNILGEVITHQTHSLYQGENTIQIMFGDNLPNGMYQIYLADQEGNQVIHKIVHSTK